MTDGCKLKVSGIGNGAIRMYGIVEGSANIINDTTNLADRPDVCLGGKPYPFVKTL